jgi:hypothetical protein
MGQWLAKNWFDLFSSLGIISGLWFTAVSLRSETKTRRIANLLTITANYREVWKEFYNSPELARVIDPTANVTKKTCQRTVKTSQGGSNENQPF